VGIDTRHDRELYEEILEQYAGVRSSVDLTPEGFDRVMKHFKALGFAKKKTRKESGSRYEHYRARWASLGLRPGMATPDQLARIECDWDSLGWWWNKDGRGRREKALRGFLRKRFGRSDLRLITLEDASKVINAVKAIQKRKEKRNGS